jgi:hypothetical protein
VKEEGRKRKDKDIIKLTLSRQHVQHEAML